MRTHTLRIEQKEYDGAEIDRLVNKALEVLEHKGHTVHDICIAAGRDAWKGSDIELRYSLTILILYD